MRYRTYHKKKKREFFWPFALLVLGIIAVILLFSLFRSIFTSNRLDSQNSIVMNVDSGTAEILHWKETEWVRAFDSNVLEGDSIQTNSNSRVVLSFFHGSQVRLAPNTKVTVSVFDSTSKLDRLVLELKQGQVWVDQTSRDDGGKVEYRIATDNLITTSTGTTFAVEHDDFQSVRVLDGVVNVDVVEKKGDKVVTIESAAVSLGQQVTLSQSEVDEVIARMPVSLVSALDDGWRQTSFATWNTEQDMDPEFSFDGKLARSSSDISGDEEADPDEDATDEETEEGRETDESFQITLGFPAESPYEFDGNTISFTGDATLSVKEITVTYYAPDGTVTPWTLGKYKPGGDWKYTASGTLIAEGENKYVVVGKDVDGNETDEIEFIVNVAEGSINVPVVEEEPAEEDDVEEDDVEEEPAAEDEDPAETTDEDAPVE